MKCEAIRVCRIAGAASQRSNSQASVSTKKAPHCQCSTKPLDFLFFIRIAEQANLNTAPESAADPPVTLPLQVPLQHPHSSAFSKASSNSVNADPDCRKPA